MEKSKNKSVEKKRKKVPKLLWEKYDAPYIRICRTILWILSKRIQEAKSAKPYNIINAYEIRKFAEVNPGNLETFAKFHTDNGIEVDRSMFTNRINSIIITKAFEDYLRNNFKSPDEV